MSNGSSSSISEISQCFLLFSNASFNYMSSKFKFQNLSWFYTLTQKFRQTMSGWKVIGESSKSTLNYPKWMKRKILGFAMRLWTNLETSWEWLRKLYTYLKIETKCSICLNLLQRPHEIDLCGHTFCLACLIRLSHAQRRNCPNCRGVINGTNLNLRLHLAIQNH